MRENEVTMVIKNHRCRAGEGVGLNESAMICNKWTL